MVAKLLDLHKVRQKKQRAITFSHTQGTYLSSKVFLAKVTIFLISNECGGKEGGQAYKIPAYYRSQTSVDKGFFQSAFKKI